MRKNTAEFEGWGKIISGHCKTCENHSRPLQGVKKLLTPPPGADVLECLPTIFENQNTIYKVFAVEMQHKANALDRYDSESN